MVIDLDTDDRIIGIEIEHASEKVDFSRLETEGLDQKLARVKNKPT